MKVVIRRLKVTVKRRKPDPAMLDEKQTWIGNYK